MAFGVLKGLELCPLQERFVAILNIQPSLGGENLNITLGPNQLYVESPDLPDDSAIFVFYPVVL